jgi:hypothetical protein
MPLEHSSIGHVAIIAETELLNLRDVATKSFEVAMKEHPHTKTALG